MARAYPSFPVLSMKQPRVSLLSLNGMLVHHRVITAVCHWNAFIHLGEARVWSTVSCLRKQHGGRDQTLKSEHKSFGLKH